MGFPIYQVDSFTDKPFAGNPAAVCILPEPKDDAWLQAVAKEMNLSETAFVYQTPEGFNLRWFTPTVEVELCGHATLATAHILWEAGYVQLQEQAKFFSRSGILTASPKNGWIELNFPAKHLPAQPLADEIIKALGVNPTYMSSNGLEFLIEVESEEIVRSLQPDFSRLAEIPSHGFIITSRANSTEYDFVSRFFAPYIGINEDPVTGSAHCYLGPYWQQKLGKEVLRAYQASARGGMLKVTPQGSRVLIAGQAVTVLRGELVQGNSGRISL